MQQRVGQNEVEAAEKLFFAIPLGVSINIFSTFSADMRENTLDCLLNASSVIASRLCQ